MPVKQLPFDSSYRVEVNGRLLKLFFRTERKVLNWCRNNTNANQTVEIVYPDGTKRAVPREVAQPIVHSLNSPSVQDVLETLQLLSSDAPVSVHSCKNVEIRIVNGHVSIVGC